MYSGMNYYELYDFISVFLINEILYIFRHEGAGLNATLYA